MPDCGGRTCVRRCSWADMTAKVLRAGVAKSDITTVTLTSRCMTALRQGPGAGQRRTRAALIAMDVVAIRHIFDVSDDFLPELRLEDGWSIRGWRAGECLAPHPCANCCARTQQVARTFDAVRRASRPGRGARRRGCRPRGPLRHQPRCASGRQGWTIRQANPARPTRRWRAWGRWTQIGILRVDRLDGRPAAVVYSYACHPLIGMPGG